MAPLPSSSFRTCHPSGVRVTLSVLLFAACYFVYTIIFTFVLGVSRSIQRQFQITDCGIGWLYAATGIAYAVTVTATAYIGVRGQKGRWIGGGFLIIALGCLALVASAFVAPLPLVEDPKDEGHLWKGAFHPLTRDDVATSLNLINTYWGEKLPSDILAYLNDTKWRVDGKTKRESTRLKKEDVAMFSRAIERVRRELYDAYGESAGSVVASGHRLTKRQLPEFWFPDELRDRLKDGFTSAVVGFMYWGDAYSRFADTLYNLTNDPEIFERLMKASRLPFAYCRNASSVVRAHINEENCRQEMTDWSLGGLVLAFVGFALIGIGSTTIWTLGAPFLDDSVGKKCFPLSLAIIFGLQALGFIGGVVLGLYFQFKVYSNFNPPYGLIPIDARWVGAWWLPFVIISILLAVLGLLLALCGGTQSKSRTPKQENDQCLVRARVGGEDYGKWQGFICAVFEACRPPIFVALLLALTFDALALKGYFGFLPKFYENNFSPSILKSAIPFWLYSVGILLGGFIIRFARLDGRKAATFIVICTLIAAGLSLALSLPAFGCNNVVSRVQKAGMENSSNGRPIWPSCQGCMCDVAEFYPVCANDSESTPYYSPCHAGCTNFTYELVGTNVEFHFNYCSCATAKLMRVSRDSCKDDCAEATLLYLALSSLAALFSGSILVPAILFVLRTTTHELRSVALGVIGLSFCVFGLLPSALLYRLIADSTCFIWRATCPNSSDRKSTCEIFDGPSLRERLHLFLGILRLVSVFFYALVLYHAKGVKLYSSASRDLVYETELHERQQRGNEPLKYGEYGKNNLTD